MLMLPSAAPALVAEARQRGTAASRESIPVDLMEDHLSMAGLATRQALEEDRRLDAGVLLDLV
jgi:histidine ammonia-lyase